jgi:hypothetical protein
MRCGVRYGLEWRFTGADLMRFMSYQAYSGYVRQMLRLPEEQGEAAFAELMQGQD